MTARGPLTKAELAAVLDRDGDLLSEVVSEREYQIMEAMAREITMHRDAMAPAMLRATRLYTDELGALRKRVAELESELVDRTNDVVLAADVCLACGDHTPGRTCQCENDE